MALELTDTNFQAQVLDSDKVSLVDFWATWCGPCIQVAPVVEELARDYAGKAIVGKVDVDKNPEVASMYRVRQIPTILIIKNGKEVDRHIGTASRSMLEQKLKAHM